MDIKHNQFTRDRTAATHSLPVLQLVLLLATVSFGGVSSTRAQTQYTSDGTPTSLEEEIRWRVNRGRFDSASENQKRGTSYTDIPSSTGPLSPHQSLTAACRHQSEDMAKNNLFQHATVPGSAYYDPVTQPDPWDRMEAEGYAWSSAGENIAAGYNGAEAVYVVWWNSTGHRVNMYGSGLREIGNGYFYWASSSYGRYYTMDLGSDSSSCFFSDTVFHDLNGNGVYDAGEGIPGVAIRLKIGSTTHNYYDVSVDVGSFAIPIQSIAAGISVTVVLSNTTAASLTLSIPTNYSTLQSVVLAAGQARTYGTFAKPSGKNNAGFRNVALVTTPMVPTSLQIAFSGPDVQLRWPSQAGLNYQPQWTSNFQTWSNLAPNALAGTGSNLTCLDAAPSSPARFYRLRIISP
jgi:uncharacterized protein YkwD